MSEQVRKKIALALRWSFQTHIENVLGVLDYSSENCDSRSLLRDHDDPIVPHTMLPGSDIDGAVANILTKDELRLLRGLEKPVVRVDNIVEADDIPGVFPDDRAVGEMAADYFMERKFKSFAVITYPDEPYGLTRAQSFAERTGAAPERVLKVSDKWEEPDYARAMDSFLGGLELPVAIFAINDALASTAVFRARKLGLTVPDDVSVLGAWNNEYICRTAMIPLSSMILPERRCGRLAAEMLDRIIDGESMQTLRLPPVRVVSRTSTDFFNVKDEIVQNTLRFIHANSGVPLHVADVADGINVNRRTLERRFREELQCSPLDEIMNVRLSLAKGLLVFTDLSDAQVAHSSGFHDLKGLEVQFEKRVGVSPAAYRAANSISNITLA